MGTRSTSIGRGLAVVEGGAGTLISFSTQPGNVAQDGTGRNSPFTAALIKHIASPNKDLNAILIGVRKDVMEATGGHQVPWEHSALINRIFLSPDGMANSTGPSSEDTARQEWLMLDKNSAAELEVFIQRHSLSPEAAYAKGRLKELREKVASTSPMETSSKPDNVVTTAADNDNVAPKVDKDKNFWVRLCERSPSLSNPKKDVDICLTHHEQIESSTGMVLVSVAIREIEGESKKGLMVMVPLGMKVPPGVLIKIDEDRKPIELSFTLCHSMGCTAETEATKEIMDRLKKAKMRKPTAGAALRCG